MSNFLQLLLTGGVVTIAGTLTGLPMLTVIGVIILLIPIVATVLGIIIALFAYLFIKD